MAVYVDDMYKNPIGAFGRMKMSHMIADSKEQLIEMAKKIGVNPKWIQYPDTYKEHFDISMGKRILAIQNGAIEISYRELGEITLERKRIENKITKTK